MDLLTLSVILSVLVVAFGLGAVAGYALGARHERRRVEGVCFTVLGQTGSLSARRILHATVQGLDEPMPEEAFARSLTAPFVDR